MSDNICLVFDFETLDLKPSGVILSMGVCMFDLTKQNTFEELVHQGFNIYFDQEEQKAAGRTVSPDTLAWWERQGPEAQECLNNPHQVPCADLHLYMAEFYKSMGYKPHPKTTRWFSRGYFDAAFLDNFCASFDMEPPYKYWCWRDIRSHLDGAGLGSRNEKLDKPKGMIPHNSWHDAAFDAYQVQQLFARKTQGAA